MTKKYETLDEYLDELDKVKEQIADETKAMSPKQVKAYFAKAAGVLRKSTGRRASGTRKGSAVQR